MARTRNSAAVNSANATMAAQVDINAIVQSAVAAALAQLANGSPAVQHNDDSADDVDASLLPDTIMGVKVDRDANVKAADEMPLANDGGEYPATYVKTDKKTGAKKRVAFAVSPTNRKLFMQLGKRVDIRAGLCIVKDDGKRVWFEASGETVAKGFSSGNHGIYGKNSVRLTLPTGHEYILTGQTIYTLTERVK